MVTVEVVKSIRAILNLHVHDELAFSVNNEGEVTVTKNTHPSHFWDMVAEQKAQYGDIAEEEFDWGDDVGTEVID